MSKTELTAGWPKPKGKCDICGVKKAAYWFGDTSVALCGDDACEQRNALNWQRMIDEANEK
jgi:hypothetical protein